jgi:hypothetical protein
MDALPSPALNAQILEEDLSIVRATLACIAEDVANVSVQAGQSVRAALVQLDQAHAEIRRPARLQISPAKKLAAAPVLPR